MSNRHEYQTRALVPVGGYQGVCLLKLTKSEIVIFRGQKELLGKWPYHCIREFREEKDVFAFTSGRRGPYGVKVYLFKMAPAMLPVLKQTISEYTGAEFRYLDELPSSDEFPPYLHGPECNSPPQSTTRQSNVGKKDKPPIKPRSQSASRRFLDSTSSGNSHGHSEHRPTLIKQQSECSPPPEGVNIREIFAKERQSSVPDSGKHLSKSFQDELKSILSSSAVTVGGASQNNSDPVNGYVNGQKVQEMNEKWGRSHVTTSLSSDVFGGQADPKQQPLPPRKPRSVQLHSAEAISPGSQGRKPKPTPPPKQFVPISKGRGESMSRMRRALSVGDLNGLPEEEKQFERSLLHDADAVFGSTKDQHMFGSRVSPVRQSPPCSPMDDYEPMSSVKAHVDPKGLSMRPRSKTLGKHSYENAEIIELHGNGTFQAAPRFNPLLPRSQQIAPLQQKHIRQDFADVPPPSPDDYEVMKSVRHASCTEDYVQMSAVSHTDVYETMGSVVVENKKIKEYSLFTSPKKLGIMKRMNSLDDLLKEQKYDTPSGFSHYQTPLNPTAGFCSSPAAGNGYDHLEKPGLKSKKGSSGAGTHHQVVTAC